MKVKYVQDPFMRSGFEAEPEDQDGWPKVPFLFTSLAPSVLSGPRKAMASAFAHLPHAAGKISLDGVISPLSAKLIQELSSSNQLFVDTNCISFKPTDIQQGSSKMHVVALDSLSDADAFVRRILSNNRENSTVAVFVPNDGMKGYLAGPRFRVIPSNLYARSTIGDEYSYFLGLASLALLYSMDLVAGSVVLHGDCPLNLTQIEYLSNAFYSVGVTLEISND